MVYMGLFHVLSIIAIFTIYPFKFRFFPLMYPGSVIARPNLTGCRGRTAAPSVPFPLPCYITLQRERRAKLVNFHQVIYVAERWDIKSGEAAGMGPLSGPMERVGGYLLE